MVVSLTKGKRKKTEHHVEEEYLNQTAFLKLITLSGWWTKRLPLMLLNTFHLGIGHWLMLFQSKYQVIVSNGQSKPSTNDGLIHMDNLDDLPGIFWGRCHEDHWMDQREDRIYGSSYLPWTLTYHLNIDGWKMKVPSTYGPLFGETCSFLGVYISDQIHSSLLRAPQRWARLRCIGTRSVSSTETSIGNRKRIAKCLLYMSIYCLHCNPYSQHH